MSLMMVTWKNVARCLFMAVLISSQAGIARGIPTQQSWLLYHAIIPGRSLGEKDHATEPVFTLRGRIQLEPNPNTELKKKDDLPYVLKMDPDIVNTVTPDLLRDVTNDQALYQLKVVAENTNGSNSPSPILTTVPACALRRANFRDELTLHLGSNAQLLSLTYMPLVSPLAPKSCQAYSNNIDVTEANTESSSSSSSSFQFDSRLSVETAVPGMTLRTVLPDQPPPPGLNIFRGASTGSGIPLGGTGGAGGNPADKDPTGLLGYLMKYWYIVVPLMLMNLLNMPSEVPTTADSGQQESGAAGGQQGRVSSGSNTAIPVVGSSTGEEGGGTVRKRRTKRG